MEIYMDLQGLYAEWTAIRHRIDSEERIIKADIRESIFGQVRELLETQDSKTFDKLYERIEKYEGICQLW